MFWPGSNFNPELRGAGIDSTDAERGVLESPLLGHWDFPDAGRSLA
jgi:hypothetical protein